MQATPFEEDASGLDFDSPAATAELEPQQPARPPAAEWAGPACEKCGAPLKSDVVTICPKCGWYASLGQFVEIDHDYEVYSDQVEQPAERRQPSHLEVWASLLPWWAWVLIATTVAVVVESIAVRLATPVGGALRTTWSLAQLGIGLLAFGGCHIFNFLVAAAEDADVGVIDIVLKPIKLWIRAARNLPQRLWVSDLAAGSLTAAAMSIFVIGGLPYERLWDWGFEKPADQNLMGAVMSRMNEVEGEGADNLEDAVGDFAGSQNLDDAEAIQPPPPPPEPRKKIDCVILGYRLDAQGRLASVVLGAALRQQLAYAGYVTPRLSDEELSALTEKLAAAKTDRPFLSVQTTAIWVEPKFSCRVSYTKRSKAGLLLDVQWEELRGQIDVQ